MAIQRISQASSRIVQPLGASGTYTLTQTLQPGLYRITTDTTQTFTAVQLYFQTTDGFRFGAVVRGGEGYVAIPLAVDQVVFTTGTFTLLLGMERLGNYSLIDAPTNVSFTYSGAFSPVTATVSFTAPPLASRVGIYWSNGTFTDFATTTSPQTAVSIPVTPTGGVAVPALVVARDPNGVWGRGTLNPTLYSFYVYTTSGNFVTPTGVNAAEVLVVAGGGGGGGGALIGYNTGYGPGGGGGAGGARYSASLAVSGTIAVTVGAGGTAGTANAGTAGGNSAFGNLLTTTGGGRGGRTMTYEATSGGSGGGGGGQGSNGAAQNGQAGTAGEGTAGGAGTKNTSTTAYPGGGGGGALNAGAAGVGSAGGVGGTGITQFGITVSGGGRGGPGGSGSAAGANTTYGGGGGGGVFDGTNGATSNGNAGTGGVVVVRAL